MKLLKKIAYTVLSLTISVSAIAEVHIVNAAESTLAVAGGWYETAYAEWTNETSEEKAVVEYRAVGSNEYKAVDGELIRSLENGNGRVDIPGLEAGNYEIRITTGDGSIFNETVKVTAYDRSGYAHYNHGDLGAYNDNGTLKTDAYVIYVTNENKNRVKYGSYTGIGNILKNAAKINRPLAVRIIGKVDTQTRDADGTKTTDINNGVVSINGLTDKASSNDSYFNMLDISNAKNVTIEGIGTDAVIEKWGMAFKSGSQNCEVRNLTFSKYPEDACSIEGSDYNSAKYFWFHNNVFNVGENKYDLTDEQDKHEGDGSMDINKCSYVTASYNQFNGCHKTSLNGGGDSVYQYHITYQHNFFNGSSSRMPLTRHADVHSYNNYFLNVGNACIDARASACVLSEANYFENSNNIYRITENSSQGNPVIKAVGDYVSNNSKYKKSEYIFTELERKEKYNVSSNKNIYANFDTNPSVFYYNEGTGNSDVMYMTDALTAKSDVEKYSGVMTNNGDVLNITNVPDAEISTETTETTTEETTETTTEATTESDKPVYGDADNNGVVEIADAADILNYVLKEEKTKMMLELDDYMYYLDVDGDNEITSADAACILQKVLDESYSFDIVKLKL